MLHDCIEYHTNRYGRTSKEADESSFFSSSAEIDIRIPHRASACLSCLFHTVVEIVTVNVCVWDNRSYAKHHPDTVYNERSECTLRKIYCRRKRYNLFMNKRSNRFIFIQSIREGVWYWFCSLAGFPSIKYLCLILTKKIWPTIMKKKKTYIYWLVNGKMYAVWKFLDVNIQPGSGGGGSYKGRGSSLKKKDDDTVVSHWEPKRLCKVYSHWFHFTFRQWIAKEIKINNCMNTGCKRWLKVNIRVRRCTVGYNLAGWSKSRPIYRIWCMWRDMMEYVGYPKEGG